MGTQGEYGMMDAQTSGELELLRAVAIAGLKPVDTIEPGILERSREAGLIALAGEAFCTLTPEGEERLEALYRDRLPDEERAAADDLFAMFSVIDPELKRIAKAWQVRDDGTKNEHDDAAYDREVLSELARLNEETQRLLRSQPKALAMIMEPFGDELDAAAKAIESGEIDRFTSADSNSYHTVWFHLHEEVLRTVGRRRTE